MSEQGYRAHYESALERRAVLEQAVHWTHEDHEEHDHLIRFIIRYEAENAVLAHFDHLLERIMGDKYYPWREALYWSPVLAPTRGTGPLQTPWRRVTGLISLRDTCGTRETRSLRTPTWLDYRNIPWRDIPREFRPSWGALLGDWMRRKLIKLRWFWFDLKGRFGPRYPQPWNEDDEEEDDE